MRRRGSSKRNLKTVMGTADSASLSTIGLIHTLIGLTALGRCFAATVYFGLAAFTALSSSRTIK